MKVLKQQKNAGFRIGAWASDAARVALLLKYGGLYMDLTCFVSKEGGKILTNHWFNDVANPINPG
jgi:mannosyltransferase OCH1-like enzyme